MIKIKDIKKILDNIEENCPILLMGDAVIDFKKDYTNPVNKVRNIDDVRELVAYYSGIDFLDYPLVIEGLSFLDNKAVFVLLKLVEESELNIILLSKFDKISPIILSRIKTKIKYYKEETKSEFLPMSKGADIIKNKVSEDSHYFEYLRQVSKYSPLIYYIDSNMKIKRNKDKIKDILS